MTGWKLTRREPTREMLRAPELGRPQFNEENWRATHDAAPSPPEPVLERMARAYETARNANRLDGEIVQAHKRIAAMRAALSAAEERGEQASTPPPSEDRR